MKEPVGARTMDDMCASLREQLHIRRCQAISMCEEAIRSEHFPLVQQLRRTKSFAVAHISAGSL